MIRNVFKHNNVPVEYGKQSKKDKTDVQVIPEPIDLDWSYIFSNKQLRLDNRNFVYR